MQYSQTRDWTCVPCIGRQTLNPWTTREALPSSLTSPSLSLRVTDLLVAPQTYQLYYLRAFLCMWFSHLECSFSSPLRDLLLHFVQVSGSVSHYWRGRSKSPCTKQCGPVLLYHPASDGVFLVIFMAACPLALVGDAAYVMTEVALKLRQLWWVWAVSLAGGKMASAGWV